MSERTACPGCGTTSLTEHYRVPQQPVVLNYRFSDSTAARNVPRRDMDLRQCSQCGLVFNALFDAESIPYDEHYENRQCFSAAFGDHLKRIAEDLTANNHLAGQRFLEIGCGKGDFLRLMCRTAAATGDGYDTSFEPGNELELPSVRFHRRYVHASEIQHSYAAIICRHVIEHVAEIGLFLKEIHDIALAAGDPVIVLETPRFEWIVEQVSFWDIFHEHCNYFPESTLAYLCRAAGMQVIRQQRVFGEQYQLLELRVDRVGTKAMAPGIPGEASLAQFGKSAGKNINNFSQKVAALAAGGEWGIWGAGAKGVALVNQLPGTTPLVVIDSNPAKQGGVISGSSIPIVAPNDPRVAKLKLVAIANPNYADEIGSVLRQLGFQGGTISL